jgi:hypothetical protein
MSTPSLQQSRGPGFTLTLVLIATAVTFALSFIPFASILTYPVRLSPPSSTRPGTSSPRS